MKSGWNSTADCCCTG